jgi:hypothetical protein
LQDPENDICEGPLELENSLKVLIDLYSGLCEFVTFESISRLEIVPDALKMVVKLVFYEGFTSFIKNNIFMSPSIFKFTYRLG